MTLGAAGAVYPAEVTVIGVLTPSELRVETRNCVCTPLASAVAMYDTAEIPGVAATTQFPPMSCSTL